MHNDLVVEILTSKDSIEFAVAIPSVVRDVCRSTAAIQRLIEILGAIGASDLSDSEKSRRAALILMDLPPAIRSDESCARALASLPNAIKMGISAVIPPEGLSLLYGRGDGKGQTVGQHLSSPKPGLSSPEERLEDGSSALGSMTVVLAARESQEANISLFRNNGFAVFRATTREELDTYLRSPDIAGFVIEGSFWSGKSREEQTAVLDQVARYSSLSCIFIDRSSFHDPDVIAEVITRALFRQPHFGQLLLYDGSILSQRDLIHFRSSSDLISPDTRPRILFSDLSKPETTALLAAASAFYKDNSQPSPARLETLVVKALTGGRSEAKLLLLTFNETGIPVVAKIGKHEQIQSEMERFTKYVRAWDQDLRPIFHYHGEFAVILFSVVEDGTGQFRPAPTLESMLNEAWLDEAYRGSSSLEAQCDNILTIVTRACRKIAALNKQRCEDHSLPSFAFLQGSSLEKMKERGIQWNLSLDRGITTAQSIEAAYDIVEPYRNVATVHGDVHLLNVLARAGIDASLIDYAYSGPGHPAYDLVRLECALYFRFLKPLDSEGSFVRLQAAITLSKAGLAELERDFKSWLSSPVNRALVKSALMCRDVCIDVLNSYGLGHRDYVAVKFIVACWSLSVPNLQWALARGCVEALAPALQTGHTAKTRFPEASDNRAAAEFVR
jgi:hypothetical protein